MSTDRDEVVVASCSVWFVAVCLEIEKISGEMVITRGRICHPTYLGSLSQARCSLPTSLFYQMR